MFSYARDIYFRISVIFLPAYLTFMHITLDFLMLVIYMLINKDLRIQIHSFSMFGAELCNYLKPDLRELRKKPFKNKIHQILSLR